MASVARTGDVILMQADTTVSQNAYCWPTVVSRLATRNPARGLHTIAAFGGARELVMEAVLYRETRLTVKRVIRPGWPGSNCRTFSRLKMLQPGFLLIPPERD